jgi:copper chaperone NosL
VKFSRPGLLALLLGLLLAAACQQSVDTSQPPEIAYGQDVCDNCNMLISEEKFAAAYWTADSQARRFDDLGEMLSYMQSNPEEIASVWVHDVNSAEWLPAEDAFFVMNAGLTTPMGTGIVAVADEAEARALAYGQDGATIMTFAEVLSANSVAPMGHSMSSGD